MIKRILAALILSFWAVTSLQAGEQINKHLPKYLKIDVQERLRVESRDNFDFNDTRDDKDTFLLYRARVNVNLIKKPFNLFVQGQDSRIANDKFFGDKAAFENFMDLRQLYVNFEDQIHIDPLAINKVSLRLGRQEFSYGGERLIGGFNWSNVAQTFDGGKLGLHLRPGHTSLDIFGGDKTTIKSPREFDDLYDGSGKDQVIGYYATVKPYQDVMVENYLFHRNTDKNISFGASGSHELSEYTAGGRVFRAPMSDKFDYEFEAAKQFGKFGTKDIEAQMAVAIMGYTWNASWSPRMALEYNYGSGDTDPSDGAREIFDNLYPTNHLFYGYIDFLSLQNLNNYHILGSFKPHKKWKLQADLHMLYLDTPKDSMYSAGRTVTRTASAALSDVSDHIGNEVDLTADFKLNPYTAFLFGYSHFFSGKYLHQTGANDDADFFYVQTMLNF